MLFVVGIEILAPNSKIEGIAVGSREIKITQYADGRMTRGSSEEPRIDERIVGASGKV